MRQRKSDRLVLNRCGTPVQLTHRYLEFLVVGLCQVAQNTKGDSLAQKHRVVAVAAPVNASMHNVTFGHGLHAGIHWRSDSDDSMLLGEAIALSVLRDLAKTYHEKFQITMSKLDGSPATIKN